MLRFLRIQRLAVIDAVEVEFDAGLNVLTGETGAGKSILVGAVGLLLGGRASADLVRTGEDAASIEAIFESDGEEILIRREITAQGRSRAFINGELATAGALKELSCRLIELHGQHEHQTLLDPATHLTVIDAAGGLEGACATVGTAFAELRSIDLELAKVREAVRDRDAREDLLAFQVAELDRAQLKPGEDGELASARSVLASADRVKRLCSESYAALYESDEAVLSALGGVWRRVADLAVLDPQFRPYLEARDSIKSQLEELASFLRRYGDSVELSPARLQEVEERLALVERLKRKYGPTLADAIAARDRLRRELETLEQGATRIADLERRRGAARDRYIALARALSQQRQRAAAEFARALEAELTDLGMDRTRFDVRFGDLDESAWTAEGLDRVEFFISPNPGEDLRPLARVASGGELSRIMLAIKTLMATSRHGFSLADTRPPSTSAPGLIFDEVDAGIGGRVADIVGRKLRRLGSAFQVLCITHLPQIAAYADTHFEIVKRVEAGRTRAGVAQLDQDARVEEISRMLGGAGVTDGIRASARELLERRASGGPPGDEAKGERRKRRAGREPNGRRARS